MTLSASKVVFRDGQSMTLFVDLGAPTKSAQKVSGRELTFQKVNQNGGRVELPTAVPAISIFVAEKNFASGFQRS